MSQSRKHVDVAQDSAEHLVGQMKLGWTCSLERWLFFRLYLDRSTLAEEQSDLNLERGSLRLTDHLVYDLNSVCDGTGLESHVGHPVDQICNRDIRMMCIKIDTSHLLHPLWYRV